MKSSCEKDAPATECGQVAVEYVAMLVLGLLLVLVLVALFAGVSDHGYRLIRLVSFNVP